MRIVFLALLLAGCGTAPTSGVRDVAQDAPAEALYAFLNWRLTELRFDDYSLIAATDIQCRPSGCTLQDVVAGVEVRFSKADAKEFVRLVRTAFPARQSLPTELRCYLDRPYYCADSY